MQLWELPGPPQVNQQVLPPILKQHAVSADQVQHIQMQDIIIRAKGSASGMMATGAASASSGQRIIKVNSQAILRFIPIPSCLKQSSINQRNLTQTKRKFCVCFQAN